MSNYTPSNIQKDTKCFICHAPYNLARHHVIHGRGLRKLAEEDGLWVWLCVKCHADLHDRPEHPHDDELKALGQRTYIKIQREKGIGENIARDLFRNRYGRFFDQ